MMRRVFTVCSVSVCVYVQRLVGSSALRENPEDEVISQVDTATE